MNLRVLNQSIVRNFNEARSRTDIVFVPTINRVAATGRSINLSTFIRNLNRAFRGIKIRVVTETTTQYGDPKDDDAQYYPAIGGYCYEPNPDKIARIEISLCVHPSSNRLPLSVESWEYFRYRFLKCIAHELVHRAQFQNGRTLCNGLIFRPHSSANLDKVMISEQSYLGDMDEVEAYARDCVEEWYYLMPDTPLTLRDIKAQFRNNGGNISPAIQYYYQTFFGDECHPSVRRFFRKIKAWDEIISPISFELPKPPAYMRTRAKRQQGVLLG